MSRHYIDLPANLPAGQATIICGIDRLPYKHYFCNVSKSSASEHVDDPIWASLLDPSLDHVTDICGFDNKLAAMGITLPAKYKDELRSEWQTEPANRVVWWTSDGEIHEGNA